MAAPVRDRPSRNQSFPSHFLLSAAIIKGLSNSCLSLEEAPGGPSCVRSLGRLGGRGAAAEANCGDLAQAAGDGTDPFFHHSRAIQALLGASTSMQSKLDGHRPHAPTAPRAVLPRRIPFVLSVTAHTPIA
jgi:hypothetical protein